MSSSQPSNQPSYQTDTHDQEDYPMMEAPDSPPENQLPSIATRSASFSGAEATTSANRSTSESKTNHGPPGSTWNNKKWHDERERVSSLLLDSDWNHATFGDPLLE